MARVYWSRVHMAKVVIDGGTALVQRFKLDGDRLVKVEEYTIPVDRAAELIESMRRDVERELEEYSRKLHEEHMKKLAKRKR